MCFVLFIFLEFHMYLLTIDEYIYNQTCQPNHSQKENPVNDYYIVNS